MTRPKASKVKVTKADGSVEIRNAYNKYDLARIDRTGSAKPSKSQGNRQIGMRHKRKRKRGRS